MLLHVLAAAWPWFTHCPPPIAATLSLLAIPGFAATLLRLPGTHCRLQRLAFRDGGWRVQALGASDDRPASIGPGTRVHAGLVAVEFIAGRERLGWLLTRSGMDPGQFRRLKARLRLAC